MARGRKKQQAGPGGAPEWMVTFSDLMSLLLTFFVLLLSFSSVNQKDFNEAMMSVQGALGVMRMHSGVISLIPVPPRRQPKKAEDAARKLSRRLQVLGLDQQVSVDFDGKGGLKIRLPGHLLFGPGSSDLNPEALPLLQEIVGVLLEFSGLFVEVRGHTDNSPLNTSGEYRDNYDLSYQRAYSVMEQIAGPGRLPVEAFEVTAAGASQPYALNTTEEGRAANRRVEIFVRGLIDKHTVKNVETGEIESAAPAEESNGTATKDLEEL